MLFLTVFLFLGTQAPPPPPPPSLPQASNSVYLKNAEEQFQNPESPLCDTDEKFLEGNCQKKAQSSSPPPPVENNSP